MEVLTDLPQPIRAVAVVEENEEKRTVWLEALPEVVKIIRKKQFGSIRWNEERGQYCFRVSRLHRYEAVLAWLREQEREAA